MTISYQIISGREITAGKYILLKNVEFVLIYFAGLHFLGWRNITGGKQKLSLTLLSLSDF